MRLNGALRGLLIIAAVAGVIVALQLWTTLSVLVLLSRVAFLLAVADVGVYWYGGAQRMELIAFLATLALCGLAMFRTWREQHRYA